MSNKLFTKSEVIKYAYVVVQYELAKYRLQHETDNRLKAILEQDVEEAYNKVNAIRELLGL
jgi:hypothetical protein